MTDTATAAADTTPSPAPMPPTTPTVPTDAASAGDGTVLGGSVAADPATSVDPVAPVSSDPAQAADPSAAAAPVVPEKYELALEGMTLDPELVTAADPVLRELGLSNEAANKLLPIAKQVQEATQAGLMRQLQDGAATQRKEWFDAFSADPEIGGPRRQESEALAARALDALGYKTGHPFRSLLNESGLGNHPDMIRAFRRMGELVGEDGGFVRTNAGGATEKPIWERLYPADVK